MNRKIIVSVAVIAGAGVFKAWSHGRPIAGIIIGSYVLLLILSILDMFGGPLSTLSGAIAMVAVVYVLIGVDTKTGETFFPWDSLYNLVTGKKA